MTRVETRTCQRDVDPSCSLIAMARQRSLKEAKAEIMLELDENMRLVRDHVQKKLDKLETSPASGPSRASDQPGVSSGPSLGKR